MKLLVLGSYSTDDLVNAYETALNRGLTKGIISMSEKENFKDTLSTSAAFNNLDMSEHGIEPGIQPLMEKRSCGGM